MAEIKFLRGSITNWTGKTDINNDYFYIVEDGSKYSLYLGSVLLADGNSAQNLAAEIQARKDGDEALSNSLTDLENSIDGKIADKIAEVVADAPENFDTLKEIADWIANDTTGAAKMANDIAALKEDSHTHDNEEVLNSISAEKVATWDAAEQNAKNYADTLASNYDAAGAAAQALADAKSYADQSEADAISAAAADAAAKYQVIGNYEVSGAAAQALADAKSYADGLASNYDAKGSATQALADAKSYADNLNTAMDARVDVLENASHSHANKATLDAISADKVTNWDDAVTKAHSHTNKEVLDGISADKVTAWDSAEQNAKTYAKSYADGLASNYDAAGAAAQALVDAKSYADGLASNYDAAGAAATAEQNAKDYADSLAKNYDAAGAAATAEQNAKDYADGLLLLEWGTF